MQRLDTATIEYGKEQSIKYLVGTLDRFNDGKRAEVADRVHHGYDDDYYWHLSGLLESQ